jgi:hypothetical protein
MSEISANRADDPSLAELLARIGKYAVVFEPASSDSLARLSLNMKAMGKRDLPADYIDFLLKTNALIWNGIQLFGTEELPRPRGFTVPSLVTANQDLPPYLSHNNQLVIGATEDEWLVVEYATDGVVYQELDRLGGEIYRQAASLQRMLTRIIKERMPR